jgi:hypothetical protein
LADAALQNWPGGGYMPMPLFFLARHSIDLHLKDPIEAYGRYSPLVPELTDHSLVASGTPEANRDRGLPER